MHKTEVWQDFTVKSQGGGWKAWLKMSQLVKDYTTGCCNWQLLVLSVTVRYFCKVLTCVDADRRKSQKMLVTWFGDWRLSMLSSMPSWRHWRSRQHVILCCIKWCVVCFLLLYHKLEHSLLIGQICVAWHSP